MSVYMITYFLSDTAGCEGHHHHDDSCGCSHNDDDSCHCGENGHEHNHVEANNNEANLIAKIKSLGPWAQFIPEGFFVKADSSAKDIFSELQQIVNNNDIIFVTEINGETSACANPAVIDWLSE